MWARATRRVWRFLLALLMVTAGSADAQNLLTNPNFDSDLSGWTELPDSYGDCAWDLANLSGPGSGCANCLNDKSGLMQTRFSLKQCVSGVGGNRIFAEAHHLVPCGQGGSGVVRLRLFYMYADGSSVQLPSDCDADGYECAVWNRSLCPDEYVPPTTDFVCVILEVSKAVPDGAFRAAFDEIILAPVSIFADGFEDSGDTVAWSTTIGGP